MEDPCKNWDRALARAGVWRGPARATRPKPKSRKSFYNKYLPRLKGVEARDTKGGAHCRMASFTFSAAMRRGIDASVPVRGRISHLNVRDQMLDSLAADASSLKSNMPQQARQRKGLTKLGPAASAKHADPSVQIGRAHV